MFNTILLLAAFTPVISPNETDSTIAHKVDLDEVTVTEFKQNKHNLTPSSISAVDSRFLHRQEVTSLKELTAIMPNFYMPDYGSKQNAPVYIRGIGAKAKGPTVGFYVDGVPHFENSAFDIDMSDIAEVNVFRGPQGTLYGRNAIGGIISVHTRSPLEYQGTRLKVGYGNQNDVSAQFANYTMMGPKLGFAVAGGYHHNDGFFRNAATGTKADGINSGFGRLTGVWKPGQQWTLRLSSMLDYSDQDGYPYGAYDRTTGKTAGVNYNRKSLYRRLISTTGFNARYDGRAFSFNSQTAYQFIKDHQAIDQDFTPRDLYFVINEIHQNMVSQEFTFKSNNDSRYQWIFGAFGMIQHINNTIETQYIAKDASFVAANTLPVGALALYHQSSYNLWRGLSLTAGLRFDYEHSRDNYTRNSYVLSTGNNNMVVRSFKSTLRFHQVTPKFTVQYLTTGKNLFYASLTRGYKAGGFNQTFRTDDERTYAPEYNWNYEVGTKLNLFGNRLMTELALFYIDWRHQQVNLTVPGVGNILHNAAHSDSKGLELTVNARPAEGLNIQMSYGYTYARFLDYHKSAKQDYSNNKLPLVPRNTLGLNASYTMMPAGGFLDRLTFSTGLTGIGRIYWAEDNAVSQDFYMLLNAKVSAVRGILTWELWGKNLTQTKYTTYSFRSSADYAQRGKPISFGTSLIVNF